MRIPTRSQDRAFRLILTGVLTTTVVSCGDGPTTPTETGFLSGTWTGTLTITPFGQGEMSGPVTWTFQVVPNTGRHNYTSTIRSQNAWLPVTATSTVVIMPADPPGQIGGTGNYTSPRGCVGDFVISGSTTANTIDAEFSGIDCVSAEASGFRQPFSGRIRVTK